MVGLVRFLASLGMVGFVLMSLVACGNDTDHKKVGKSWTPEKVRLTCPSGDCPDAVGVLVFLKDVPGGYYISRCTATTIESRSILTNAHCDDKYPDYNRAYFIQYNPSGNAIIANVVTKTYEQMGEEAGLSRDMALYQIDRVLPGTPKRISRQIPPRLDKWTAYVVDQSYWDTDFTDLTVQKRNCDGVANMQAFGGGYEDKTLALGLFNCEVRPGNSGSAVYATGDTTSIQALLNTLWKFGTANDKAIDHIRGYFSEMPSYLKNDFGMAERLHCASIPGQPEPAEFCHMMDYDQTVGAPFRAAMGRQIEQWFNKSARDNGNTEWTLATIGGEMRESLLGNGRPTAMLIPVPYCTRSSQPSAGDAPTDLGGDLGYIGGTTADRADLGSVGRARLTLGPNGTRRCGRPGSARRQVQYESE